MEIECSAIRKAQHCVLWLDGASMAWRTKSCIGKVAVPEDGIPGVLRPRAALCSASPDEQAVNVGGAVAQAAARSSCLRDGTLGLAGEMFTSWVAVRQTMHDRAK